MTVDYPSVISEEAARIVSAYESDPSAAIPWSDRWSVGTVARHVAGTHHVVAELVRGRPGGDFGLFATLETPAKDSPEFVPWFRAGTASLIEQLSSVPADDECWTWYADGGHVGWWARRMALEAVIHRYDTDAAQGRTFSVAADVAADGVDEYLDVFVAASRGNGAPAGPTIGFECSDRSDRWWLDLSEPGTRVLSRDARPTAVQVRGTAVQLLLGVWGRIPLTGGDGMEVSGEAGWMDQWPALVPPM